VLCEERRYQEASTSLSEASRLIKNNAINDPRLEVQILDVSGTAYLGESQLRKAEALFQRALRIISLPQNAAIPESGDVFNNLATLYAVKGNYPKAAAYYIRALDTAEKRLGPTHPSIATVLVNMGFAYIRAGQYEEAESRFLRSLKILDSNGLMS
jgi:tetratricopeptide (TPR) repeat protein